MLNSTYIIVDKNVFYIQLDSKIKMIYQLETIIAKSNNKNVGSQYKMGQIQSTIMCNGTTAVRICEKKLFTM